MAHEIYERNNEEDNNSTIPAIKLTNNKKYSVGFSKVFLDNGCALLKFNLWLTGLLLKVIIIFNLYKLI